MLIQINAIKITNVPFKQELTELSKKELFRITGSYSTRLFVLDQTMIDYNSKFLYRNTFKRFSTDINQKLFSRLSRIPIAKLSRASFKEFPGPYAFFVEDYSAERIFQKTYKELQLLRETGLLYYTFHKGKIIYPIKQLMELCY